MAALGLRCCPWAFSSCGERGLPFIAMHRLLSEVVSLCCGAQAVGTRASVVAARELSSCGLRALERRLSSVVHRLSCSAACGIFLDQGSNLCPLHWQVDS